MPGIQLREHQVDQKSAFRKWVGFPTRSPVPPEGARATIVSATGSGKTITAAACALECFPEGRILVTVPTLDLLVQTAQAWRAVGHRSPMVAVCSLESDPVLNELGVRTTTNPIQLALWAGHGPVIVFATYASLVDREDFEDPMGQGRVRGPLEAALAGGERLYGQRMAGFSLAIVDEAHGTTGDLGRPWAAIHDNARIPADFRLYLTATPRILASPRPQKGADGQEAEIASMADDPDGTFGAWLPGAELGLSEAIEREILAPFEIDVLEIRDPSPILGESEEAQRGRRLALLQTALLEHAAAYNLRTVMTFHQKVEEAAAFAEKLPETAAELYVTETDDETMVKAEKELPASSIDAEFYGLEAGRHVPPDRVWAAWLCGDHLVSERREVLRQFANGIDANNRRVHRAFLASVRVLGEGVDITGERGVEAICFADTRGSQVEIVQNIGRALRLNRDGSTKVARIIVPIFLGPGEDPTDMVASASFRPLVAVLQGLRSHDERLVEQLASRALSSGKRKVHVQRDEDGQIIGTGGTGEDQEQDDTDAAAESALLHFSSPRDASTIAAFLRTRVYRPDSLVWLEGYQALLRWRTENEITGLYAVPYDVEVEVGVTKAFPLGRWVHQQRKTLRAGELEDRRKTLLDAPEAGMVWEPGEEAWENKLAALRSYRRAMGHLAPRQDAVWGEGEGEAMVPVGQHAANLRRKGGLGKDAERAAVRAQQLAAVDEDWNCPWPLDWQRHYRVLADLVDADGHLPDIAPGVLFDGDDLGKWLQRQKNPGIWKQLSSQQQERLTELGIKPVQAPFPAQAATRATKGPGKAQQAFQRGLAALAQWVEREGAHRPVPRGHAEEITVDGDTKPVVVKLGVWVSNTKSRRDKLAQEQLDALRELGVEWA
ncbi:Helicase associated domain protein [Streptomyces europaeiscabiei]|uniref:DEAD/DEAH box helicase n=1 Tax=Streptomyces europaeiscabiei TaxID=146819 RepID=UPI0029A7E29B|nr:Helicase associated domain protein [Streptomyces europaeiscabiei]MDX3697601.1 Helicase associated domain protein [Streptomyces europaeiscabiei]